MLDRFLHPSDERRTQIESAFPWHGGQSEFERETSNRLAFEVALCRARTGYSWRDLPAAHGDDLTIYTR